MPKQKTNFRYEKPTGKLIDKTNHLYKCTECGGIWSTNISPGGRMPDNYRRCPHCDLIQ